MTGGFPLLGSVANAQDAGSASVGGTLLTSNAAANTKGTFSQLVASTGADAAAFLLQAINATDTGVTFDNLAFDIAIGGAGNEKIIVPNVVLSRGVPSATAFPFCPPSLIIPIAIPAGTRIAARCQDSQGGGFCRVACQTLDGGFTQSMGGALFETAGFDAANSRGTVFTLGASSANGSYSQIIASTSSDYVGFFFCFDQNAGTSGIAADCRIDIAIGGAGSEKVIIPDVLMDILGAPCGPLVGPFIPMAIPSGTRIAVRGANTSVATPALGFTFYGLRA